MAIVYVDPSTGVDDVGTAGTSGDPYLTIQYAIDNYPSWATTGGNTIKLANTAALVLSASINVSSIAATASPLCIEGWDNGGTITGIGPRGTIISPCGEIDGNDAVSYALNVACQHVVLKNLKIHSTTAGILYLSTGCTLYNCELYNGTGRIIQGALEIRNCFIHNDVSAGATGLYIANKVFDCEVRGVATGISPVGSSMIVSGTIISDFESKGIDIVQSAVTICGNTIDGTGSNSNATGISNAASRSINLIYNNLITNLDGATAVGISLPTGSSSPLITNNSFYNCTTEIDADQAALQDNITETSDPFVDSANYDFSLRDGALSQNSAIFKPIP